LDIHFTVRTSCEIAAPLAKKKKCHRVAPCTEKSDKPAVAFFSASGAALSQEVPTVTRMSNQPAL
jgi:hypothetical protein